MALVGLAGCGAFNKAPPKRACPPVQVLGDAGELTRFRPGPGRDITDVLLEAKIVDFIGDCEWREDIAKLRMQVVMQLRRGPANRDRTAKFEFFVAIPKLYPDPAAKKLFPVSVTYPTAVDRIIFRDNVYMEIDIPRSEKTREYEIYIGLQLSEAELDYNRQRTGR